MKVNISDHFHLHFDVPFQIQALIIDGESLLEIKLAKKGSYCSSIYRSIVENGEQNRKEIDFIVLFILNDCL